MKMKKKNNQNQNQLNHNNNQNKPVINDHIIYIASVAQSKGSNITPRTEMKSKPNKLPPPPRES